MDRRVEITLKVTNYLSLVHVQLEMFAIFFLLSNSRRKKKSYIPSSQIAKQPQTDKQKNPKKTLKNICLPLQMV